MCSRDPQGISKPPTVGPGGRIGHSDQMAHMADPPSRIGYANSNWSEHEICHVCQVRIPSERVFRPFLGFVSPSTIPRLVARHLIPDIKSHLYMSTISRNRDIWPGGSWAAWPGAAPRGGARARHNRAATRCRAPHGPRAHSGRGRAPSSCSPGRWPAVQAVQPAPGRQPGEVPTEGCGARPKGRFLLLSTEL